MSPTSRALTLAALLASASLLSPALWPLAYAGGAFVVLAGLEALAGRLTCDDED